MEITRVRVKLVGSGRTERLLAFASVTFDNSFVVREIRVIDGPRGAFVAMPSRKLTERCRDCGCTNHLRAKHCNNCGCELPPDRAQLDERGRARLYTDIAHPINSQCREQIQSAVLRAYGREKERADTEPGSEPRALSADEVADAGSEGTDDDVAPQEDPPQDQG